MHLIVEVPATIAFNCLPSVTGYKYDQHRWFDILVKARPLDTTRPLGFNEPSSLLTILLSGIWLNVRKMTNQETEKKTSLSKNSWNAATPSEAVSQVQSSDLLTSWLLRMLSIPHLDLSFIQGYSGWVRPNFLIKTGGRVWHKELEGPGFESLFSRSCSYFLPSEIVYGSTKVRG